MSKKKNKEVKKPDENLKKEMSWKNNLFARYMLFRYSLALFFFSNVYWIMISMYKSSIYIVFPIVLVLLMVVATAEQFRLYGKRQATLKWTKIAFKAQLVGNIIAILITLFPSQFIIAFPTFNENLAGRGFILAMQVLGMLIVWFNLHRASQVERNSDRFYYRFVQNFGKLI